MSRETKAEGGPKRIDDNPATGGEYACRALGEPRMMDIGPLDGLQVAAYADAIEEARTDTERYRMLVYDLLRCFRQLDPGEQRQALELPPRLTGTRWDALLAASAEYAAQIHGHPVPAWCCEPERSLRVCWTPLPVFGRVSGFVYPHALGAYLRHGVLVAAWELGPREGRREYACLDGS